MADDQSTGDPRPRRPPYLSGQFAAAWLVVGLVLSAALIPFVLRLPLWVEAEIVLAVWWVVWLAVLTGLLHAGRRVSDDHGWQAPRNWFGRVRAPSGGDMVEGCISLPFEFEGCLFLLALVALIGAVWFLIEIAVPALALLVYIVARGMIAHVTNDRHHCQGHWGRSLAWAFVWATAYTAPLALAVWFVHAMRVKA